jgi:phage terminase large subunit-like protein
MSADGQYYILADDTIKASPQDWALKAITAFEAHKADRIVAETYDNGGDLVLIFFHSQSQYSRKEGHSHSAASNYEPSRSQPCMNKVSSPHRLLL